MVDYLPTGWRLVAFADLGTWYGEARSSKGRSGYWTNGTVAWP